MSALYWDDFDCTPASRAIEHPSTVHLHFDNEQDACRALLKLARDYWPEPGKASLYEAGERYHCVCGPGGLVRGVRF